MPMVPAAGSRSKLANVVAGIGADDDRGVDGTAQCALSSSGRRPQSDSRSTLHQSSPPPRAVIFAGTRTISPTSSGCPLASCMRTSVKPQAQNAQQVTVPSSSSPPRRRHGGAPPNGQELAALVDAAVMAAEANAGLAGGARAVETIEYAIAGLGAAGDDGRQRRHRQLRWETLHPLGEIVGDARDAPNVVEVLELGRPDSSLATRASL